MTEDISGGRVSMVLSDESGVRLWTGVTEERPAAVRVADLRPDAHRPGRLPEIEESHRVVARSQVSPNHAIACVTCA